MDQSDYLITGSANSPTIVLAHGAGARMDTPFMEYIAGQLAQAGIRVVRFEFPYMRERRESGSRRPPNPPRVLMDSWNHVISDLGEASKLIIGGKSMGGRIASMVADDAGVGASYALATHFIHPADRTNCALPISKISKHPL